MEAKEKAVELVNKFTFSGIYFIAGKSGATLNAKICALIAVGEILENIDATILYHKESKALPKNKNYWQQVKQEIEKL